MSRKRLKLNADYVRSLLRYEPDTGEFWWRVQRGSRSDLMKRPAGTIIDGYRLVVIDGALYPAHRLAWLMQTGEWPEQEIDHENNKRADNRWSNLRAATVQENRRNRPCTRTSKSGFKGVWWKKSHKKWMAQIGLGGHQKTIGYFGTAEEAAEAYAAEARKHHGAFANWRQAP